MVMTGIFANGRRAHLGLDDDVPCLTCGALVFVTVFAFVGSWILYKVTDCDYPAAGLGPKQEEIGLD